MASFHLRQVLLYNNNNNINNTVYRNKIRRNTNLCDFWGCEDGNKLYDFREMTPCNLVCMS